MWTVDQATIEDTAEKTQLDLALIEKDFRLTEVLDAVVSTPIQDGFRFIFAGGTCLARAYNLTGRMSEDVDVKIAGNSAFEFSANQLRRALSTIKADLRTSIEERGFTVENVASRNNNRNTKFEIHYPPAFTSPTLRPHILLETTVSVLRLDPVCNPMRTFVAEAFGRPPEIDAVACTSLEEAFAEKFVSLTRRVAGILEGSKPETYDLFLIRHLHDLHHLRDRVDTSLILSLIDQISWEDAVAFRSWFPGYADDRSGWTLKAVSWLAADRTSHSNYAEFQAQMVYGGSVPFSVAMDTVSEIAERVFGPSARMDGRSCIP